MSSVTAPNQRWAWLLGGLVLLGCVLSGVVRSNRASDRRVIAAQATMVSPTPSRDEGYVSSDTCKACHPGEYSSWHRTYHRTMTQVATPETVKGNFDNVKLEYFGRTFHLTRDDSSFWISQSGGTSKRVLQTTGSHHYQVYWVGSGKGNMLHNFPFVYLLDDERWVRRNDVFMMPPAIANQPESILPWNDSCIACHSTHGQPKVHLESKFANTEIAELGISCEACHGPAEQHIEHYRNPITRYAQHYSDQQAASIINPATCSSHKSTQICGQCHGVTRAHDRNAWQENGFKFRPGDELEDSRIVARHPARVKQSWHDRAESDFFDQYFWKDGMIRVSGREYNGLLETPCYQRGELSCLSCHSMHDSDPNDQLKRQVERNDACIQCHQGIASNIAEHTHHSPSSAGSLCYNCHMPHTTYGLVKAIRSHEIDSPDVSKTLASGRPQACNLCHLDKSLGWTATHLNDWYGQPVPALSEDQKTVSAALLDVLSGDAGQRAIAAWHMGWEPALEASGRNWLAPFLAELLNDSYTAVRYIAIRSLRGLPGFEAFEFDFTSGEDSAVTDARQLWRGFAPVDGRSEILLNTSGELLLERVNSIRQQRDERPVDLLE